MAVCTVAFTGSSPNKHAPIGVMADHMHHHGEFMFSYRYMHMLMEDNESSAGTMLMDMHMIGMMYAPTDNITLMLMTNYLNNDMEMNMGNMNMTQSSQGLGDMSVTGLFQFKTAERTLPI